MSTTFLNNGLYIYALKLPYGVLLFSHSSIQGHKEWINEVNCLGVVKHPNLVKLVGYCAEDDERGIQRLLVYELMHNKSLEDHLLARVPSSLPWLTRLKIARDAARGLAYLHEEMDFQVRYSFSLYSFCFMFLSLNSVLGELFPSIDIINSFRLRFFVQQWSFPSFLHRLYNYVALLFDS